VKHVQKNVIIFYFYLSDNIFDQIRPNAPTREHTYVWTGCPYL